MSAPMYWMDESRDMRIEANRLKSLEKWPVKFMDLKLCATSGLFYCKFCDWIQCAFCDAIILKFYPGECPLEVHLKCSPRCSYLQKLNTECIDDPLLRWKIKKCFPENTPKYPLFNNFDERLKTFSDWKLILPDSQSLCEAGFFFKQTPDIVQCYHCGIELGQWELKDIPFIEHSRHSPTCDFIKIVKGSEYVENAKNVYSESQKLDSDIVLRETSDKSICRICLEEKPRRVVYPCFHCLACRDCLQDLTNCPLCRTRITTTLPLFFD